MLTSESAASKMFARSRKGYSRDEVEALRARIVVALTLSERGIVDGLPVGADDLIEYELGFGRKGYDHAEVDRFIDEAAAVLRRRGAVRATPAGEAKPIDTSWLGSAFGGYAKDEVDRFAKDVAAALSAWEAGERPALTATDAERRTFASKRRGYDLDDVEELVSIAVRELGRHEAANPLPEDEDEDEGQQA
jgi:hypothetical protein